MHLQDGDLDFLKECAGKGAAPPSDAPGRARVWRLYKLSLIRLKPKDGEQGNSSMVEHVYRTTEKGNEVVAGATT